MMVNGYLAWSKTIWIGQWSLGLNSVDFDTLESVMRKKTNFKTVIRKEGDLQIDLICKF